MPTEKHNTRGFIRRLRGCRPAIATFANGYGKRFINSICKDRFCARSMDKIVAAASVNVFDAIYESNNNERRHTKCHTRQLFFYIRFQHLIAKIVTNLS